METDRTRRCTGVCAELAAGAQYAARDPAFLSMLGVTFFANFCYWSHQPLLQVLATDLGADASGAGLLVSASGWGGLLASVLVTFTNPSRTGLLYCLGIAAADVVRASTMRVELIGHFKPCITDIYLHI